MSSCVISAPPIIAIPPFSQSRSRSLKLLNSNPEKEQIIDWIGLSEL